MKILIVEDEPSLREIMVRTLTREQYEAFCEQLRKQEEAVAEMIYQTEDCKRGLTSLTENENGPMCEFLGR